MKQETPTITIITAQALTKTQLAFVSELVTQKIGAATFNEVVDPTVVGGLKITVGGQEFDATIAGKLQKLESQLQRVTITTAVPLTDTQRKLIKETIEKKMGPQNFVEIVEPSIVGGIKILVGSKEYDGSIKGKLQHLQEMMLQNI